jgi:predicted amidohydrolase YtcJ
VTDDSAPADLVLRGGTVHTVAPVEPDRPPPTAVAVRGGRILAVGTDAEIRERSGPRTEVVDLEGGMLLPGFQDAHVHPGAGGLQLLLCDLSELETVPDYLAAIGRYAAERPDLPWILGGGWSLPAFPHGLPDRASLDAVVPDRPAYLPNRDGHSAWVNTRALELAGITRDTPDPADGRIERDAAGEPSGALHEGAMRLVERLAPEPGPAERREALLAGQAYLHALGITGWQDAIVDGPLDTAQLETYLDLASSGELTARVVGALWWERDRGGEQVEGLVERRARGSVGRFRATSVKIMQDGVCETFTAAMLSPYLDTAGHPTGGTGISFVDPEALKEHVVRLHREGFQVHFHALGDRAVRESLDAVEAAVAAAGPRDLRHHLAHVQVVHPDDVPRFAPLGAVANCQPLWARNEPQMTELTIPFLGPERAGWQYPFGDLHRSGARLAFGSDWPVSSPDPMGQLHTAVTRQPPALPSPHRPPPPGNGVPAPFLPEQRLSLRDALHAFTLGSAYVNHAERDTGSIEPGKYADLTVLDRDLFALPPQELHTARVRLTLVEGQAVHEAS